MQPDSWTMDPDGLDKSYNGPWTTDEEIKTLGLWNSAPSIYVAWARVNDSELSS